MTVLVTGGLGFIGHNVVEQLELSGFDTAVVDSQINTSMSSQQHHQYILHKRRRKIRSAIYHTDITDRPGMATVFNNLRPSLVIHLASIPRQAQARKDPYRASQVMIEGLINLLELTQHHGTKRFVFVSSSMVYGHFADGVQETDICHPQGQYSILKFAGELLVQDYSARYGFEHVIIRPSAVYGEHDLPDRVLAKFLTSAIRDQDITVNGPEERLDFTHVSDAARGIVQASLSDNCANRVYNITRGTSRTLLEAANIVRDIVGQGNIVLQQRDETYPSRGFLDISAAKADFGYDPKVDLEEGIQNYYHWLKDSFFWTP